MSVLCTIQQEVLLDGILWTGPQGKEMPGVSLGGIRAWWMGEQALKEFTRGPNLARVQGAREGFLKEAMG